MYSDLRKCCNYKKNVYFRDSCKDSIAPENFKYGDQDRFGIILDSSLPYEMSVVHFKSSRSNQTYICSRTNIKIKKVVFDNSDGVSLYSLFGNVISCIIVTGVIFKIIEHLYPDKSCDFCSVPDLTQIYLCLTFI